MLALIISARRGSRVRNPFAGTDMRSSWKVESYRKEEKKMTSMTAFAEAMAMPTTQLTRVIQYEDAASRQLESHAERKSPRMSWVVVTDKNGRRQLRIQWEPAVEN
jgi:hypothetical protein